ncbi:MAG: tetratricopeptide repeat protein [Paludibacter sp.]|nr:MAG: tetratricopeptide repeat protein [Paludibacter sp.]
MNAMKLAGTTPLERVNDGGKYQEYYGSTNSIILTYKDKTAKSGVAEISYLSRDKFEAVTKNIPDTPVGEATTTDKPLTSNDKDKPKPAEKAAVKETEVAKISPEAKQHLQQGMTYVSLAKSNPKTKSENYNNALLEFSKAIEISPKYAEAYSDRGVVYMQQKKYNKAEVDLKKAAELNPKDPYILYNLTALYSIEKKNDLALDYLDQALANGFNNYDVLRPSGKDSDPDLANLRKDPEFKKVLEKHKVFIMN